MNFYAFTDQFFYLLICLYNLGYWTTTILLPNSPVHCSIVKDLMSVCSEIIIKGRAVQSPTKMNTNWKRNLFGYEIFWTCKSRYLFTIFTISEHFIDLNLNDIRVGNWVHASYQSVKNGHRCTHCDCDSLVNLRMKNVFCFIKILEYLLCSF